MYFLNNEDAWSMDTTSELGSFYWGSFTAVILPDTSYDLVLTLLEVVVEALLFVFATVLKAILSVFASLCF